MQVVETSPLISADYLEISLERHLFPKTNSGSAFECFPSPFLNSLSLVIFWLPLCNSRMENVHVYWKILCDFSLWCRRAHGRARAPRDSCWKADLWISSTVCKSIGCYIFLIDYWLGFRSTRHRLCTWVKSKRWPCCVAPTILVLPFSAALLSLPICLPARPDRCVVFPTPLIQPAPLLIQRSINSCKCHVQNSHSFSSLSPAYHAGFLFYLKWYKQSSSSIMYCACMCVCVRVCLHVGAEPYAPRCVK